MGIGSRIVPDIIRRRYALKFGIALLILGLSVGLIGFAATAGITNEVEDRVHEEQAAAAGQQAENLQLWHEQNEGFIEMVTGTDSVEDRDEESVEHRMNWWQEHLAADIFSMHYVDTESSDILASTHSELRGGSVDDLDTPNGSALIDNATVSVADVSKPYQTEDELGQEAAVVTYVQLVPDQDDRAIVYTAELDAYVNRLGAEEGTTTMVLDGDDEVMIDDIGYGEDYETLGEAYDPDSEIPTTARQGTGSERVTGDPAGALSHDAYEFDTDDHIASYAPVLGTDDEAMWVVVTHEPTDDAYGFVNQVDQYGMLATLFGVLLIGLVGAVLGRNTAVSIDRLTDKAGRMEEGDLEVEFETGRIDNIGRLYAGFASMRDALKVQIDEAEVARKEAEDERERIAEINAHLEEKADEYSSVMEAAAEGDLTARMSEESENEAMSEIAREFNDMLTDIEGTVDQLTRFATEVATASEEVTASSEEVRSASEKVTDSIQEISDGADRQDEALQSVNREMEGLSTTTEEIAASSNEVADIAERTATSGERGSDAAGEAIDAMEDIENDAESAVNEIRQLEEEVKQIDELITAITEIAKQTNMLALNANIEASRSGGGQDDEGFTVVAQEVKELSQDVKAAAEEVEKRLNAIRKQTVASAEEVEATSEQVEYASEQVAEAVDALEEIATYALETNDGVQEISAATEQQAASTQEVVAMVDEAAEISQRTTSESENVAAAAEEQTTALTEVSRSASDLSTQAAQLSEALDRFETDPDADAGTEVTFEQGTTEEADEESEEPLEQGEDDV